MALNKQNNNYMASRDSLAHPKSSTTGDSESKKRKFLK